MPTYDYRCKQCGKTHEIAHGFNDPRPSTCPSCGGQLVRVFHPVGVVFKGSGFHKTDYASSGVKKDAGETAAGKGEGAGSKTDSGVSTSSSDKAKADTKPSAPAPPPKSDSKPQSTS